MRKKIQKHNLQRLALYFGLLIAGAILFLWYRPVHAPTQSKQPIENQYEITANDSGKTFIYPLTSRFSVFLDEAHYPKGGLACTPSGIVGPISNIPAVSPPLYVVRFEAAAPGSCVLQDKDFSVTIVVTDLAE